MAITEVPLGWLFMHWLPSRLLLQRRQPKTGPSWRLLPGWGMAHDLWKSVVMS